MAAIAFQIDEEGKRVMADAVCERPLDQKQPVATIECKRAQVRSDRLLRLLRDNSGVGRMSSERGGFKARSTTSMPTMRG